MKLESLSATALHVSELCLSRYQTEHLHKIPRSGIHRAASIGSTVHLALERFVDAACIKKTTDWSDEDFLRTCGEVAYHETFHSADTTTEDFKECWELVQRWYARTDLSNTHVLSVEEKRNFLVPTSIGKIPFNYIWDRCDQLDDHVYEVVDYKTSRWNVGVNDLETKLQARAYALACRIEHPDAEKIWVTFDMLRHTSVGLEFTRDDAVAFWAQLKRTAQKIVDTPDDNVPETLNPECRWCAKLARCKEVRKNHMLGGIHSLTLDEMARAKYEIDNQLKALEVLSEQLEEQLSLEAERRDEFEMELDGLKVGFSVPSRRRANHPAIAAILGPDLSREMGRFTLGQLDDLLESGRLSYDQVRQVKAQITQYHLDPKIKIKAPAPLTET